MGHTVQSGDMKRRPGNGIEGAMVCTSLGSLLRPLFYFLDDVSYLQSVDKVNVNLKLILNLDQFEPEGTALLALHRPSWLDFRFWPFEKGWKAAQAFWGMRRWKILPSSSYHLLFFKVWRPAGLQLQSPSWSWWRKPGESIELLTGNEIKGAMGCSILDSSLHLLVFSLCAILRTESCKFVRAVC